MKKAMILFLMIFSFCQGVCNSLTWNAPQTISGTTASDPKVVMDASGNVTSAWVEGGLIKASTLPWGGSWGTIVTLSGSGASLPKIGVDSSGNVTAIWLEGGVVNYATLPFGGSWSAAASISSSGASTPALAVDATGNAVAVWARGGFIETSTKLFGGSWSVVNAFTDANSDHPDVAIGSTGVTVAVWHNVVSGQDHILSSRATTVGGSWSATMDATTLAAATAVHHWDYPRVTVGSLGNAVATWYQSDFGGSFGTDYVSVTPVAGILQAGTSSWTLPFVLTTSGLGERNPADLRAKIGIDTRGNIFGLWSSSVDGSLFEIDSGSRLVGVTYPGSTQLTALNLYAFQGDFAINSLGDAVVAYMAWDGSSATIQSVETIVGSFQQNFFTIPIAISTGTNNGYPRIATTFDGSAVKAAAVWISSDGVNNTISAATASKTVIAPPTSLSVTQNVNSFGVFNEYYNTISWTASTDPSVIGYVIYRDGIILSEVGSSDVQFIDHNRVQSGAVTYGVAAFESDFQQSTIVNVNYP